MAQPKKRARPKKRPHPRKKPGTGEDYTFDVHCCVVLQHTWPEEDVEHGFGDENDIYPLSRALRELEKELKAHLQQQYGVTKVDANLTVLILIGDEEC